jgi:hypothetical protein
LEDKILAFSQKSGRGRKEETGIKLTQDNKKSFEILS